MSRNQYLRNKIYQRKSISIKKLVETDIKTIKSYTKTVTFILRLQSFNLHWTTSLLCLWHVKRKNKFGLKMMIVDSTIWKASCDQGNILKMCRTCIGI